MKLLATALCLVLSVLGSPVAKPAPLLNIPRTGLHDRDDYIVVLKSNFKPSSVLNALEIPFKSSAIFEQVLNGFAGNFNAATISLLRAHEAVSYIERDSQMTAKAVQNSATYNLAITSQANKLAPAQQNTYYYKAGTGAGVRVFILDTGIRITHTEFEGRATNGYNPSGSDFFDTNGHGTHVAGIIGGKTYGVAKNASLVSIKILDASGSTSTSKVLDGINWSVKACGGGRCVMNLAIGGTKSAALNSAVDNAYNQGVLSVVAAGNENYDACQNSPASANSAMVVSNIGPDYARTSSANIGGCVDIFAPGQYVKSAWYTSDTATNMLSGTSISAPNIAGIAAYFLSIQNRNPADLVSYILSKAQKGLITNAGAGSPNLIGNNGWFFGVQ